MSFDDDRRAVLRTPNQDVLFLMCGLESDRVMTWHNGKSFLLFVAMTFCAGLGAAQDDARPDSARNAAVNAPQITAGEDGVDTVPTTEEDPTDPQPLVPAPGTFGLDQIEDVTVLSWSDVTAYYALLAHARAVSQTELRKAGREFVQQRRETSGRPTFPDMLMAPQAWRGKPVTLQGHLLQTIEFEAADNPYGIETLYESALYTDDSVHHPLTIVYLDKPPELPIGGETVGNVVVSGYFLKLYVYPSSDKKSRKAPLILAKTITVIPPPDVRPIISPSLLLGAITLLILGLIFIVWKNFRADRQRLEQIREREQDQSRPDFNQLP